MWKKIFKLFMVYSYVSLLCYVASEQLLVLTAESGDIVKNWKTESIWKTTLKRFKRYLKD